MRKESPVTLPDDAGRFARILLEDSGSVIELRAFGVDGVRGSGILSGYFNDVDALLKCAQALDGRARSTPPSKATWPSTGA